MTTKDEAITLLVNTLEALVECADKCIPNDNLSNAELADAENKIATAYAVISEISQKFNVEV